MEIKSTEIKLISPDLLQHHPKNMHKHSDDQIKRLCQLIEYQGWRVPVIVQKGTNLVVAGNGRLMAARKMGIKEVPVIEQEFESEAQLYAFMVSDNAIGKDTWANLDLSAIHAELPELGPFDIELLGFKDFSFFGLQEEESNNETPEENPNKKHILQIELPTEMDLRDLYDDLLSKGYLVKEL